MSVILDGTGFTLYNIDRQRSIRDLELRFTAYSDGEVTRFQSKYMVNIALGHEAVSLIQVEQLSVTEYVQLVVWEN